VSADDTGWQRASEAYQDRLMRAIDIADRLQLLSDAPMYSFWSDIKSELARASDEIRMLRRQLEEARNDTA
jgi:hypothetical protein